MDAICCHGWLLLLLAVAASGAGAAGAPGPGDSSHHVELDIMESLLPVAGASSCSTSQLGTYPAASHAWTMYYFLHTYVFGCCSCIF
jgi:hypothetical protein